VIALRQANPDAVLLAVIPKHGALFMKEAQKLGWKPKVVGHNTMADPVVTDLAGDALEGIYVNLMTAVDSMDRPQVKLANAILAKYSPNAKPGYYPYLGMAGAVIFVEGAKKAGGDLTRAKLIKALEDTKRIETGLVPPLEWSAKYHGGPLAFGYATWQNGKLKVLQGW
jgi:ABC-type branched-subunit amino acid transport system substrate-binding protein